MAVPVLTERPDRPTTRLTPRVSGWSPRRVVLLVAGAVLLLRLTYLAGPPSPDEAGYSIVARGWRVGGPNLYGHYFVDRPPLLIALYRLAWVTGRPETIRCLATGFAVLMVLVAAWAARQVVSGPARAWAPVWAAVVAGSLVTTPLLRAQEADGELFAAPLVMVSVGAALAAVRHRGRPSFWFAALAGFSAGAAVMVKQNFLDGGVFAAVLLAVAVRQRRLRRGDAARILAGGLAGVSVVVGSVLVLVARSRTGLSTAWTAVFGFRGAALDVIEDHSLHAPLVRAAELVALGVLSGLLPLLLAVVVVAARGRLHRPPVVWALAAALLYDAVSIALGGSYWPHYLIQLAPMAALGAALWAPGAVRVRVASVAVAVSAVVATAALGLHGSALGRQGEVVGAWLHRSGRPGDTATVLYGHAEVQEASGMASPYPQLWSLPMRALDPRLTRLRAVLRGPEAPTWLVAWGTLDPWHLDVTGRTRLDIADHYRPVADVCGHEVYLRDGVRRPLDSTSSTLAVCATR